MINQKFMADSPAEVGIDAIRLEELLTRVRKEVDESIKKGIFGSPTFMLDNEMIWGSDRLWMLEHLLKHGNFSAENIAS